MRLRNNIPYIRYILNLNRYKVFHRNGYVPILRGECTNIISRASLMADRISTRLKLRRLKRRLFDIGVIQKESTEILSLVAACRNVRLLFRALLLRL